MKLLIALIGAGSALPSAEVSRDLPIDGAFWTQWSTYYGCSQFQFDEFCRYPNKAKLSAYRYRVCVLPDLRNYPQNLFDNQKRQGMFESQIKNNDKFTDEDAFIANYENIDYMNTLVPQTADPSTQVTDFLNNQATKFVFDKNAMTTANQPNFCGQDKVTGLQQNCLTDLASINKACDPRIQKYVADNPDLGLTVEKVVELIESQDSDNQDVKDVRSAIPGPYLVEEKESALCDTLASSCPQPLPWTSWSCHCPQGSKFQEDHIFSDNENPDNLPLCECGGQKRRRYQLCKDSNQEDKVTCESMGNAIQDISEYNNLCLIDDTQQQWWRPYLPEKSLVSNYNKDSTNWYQLANWKQSREDSNSLKKVYQPASDNEDETIENLIIETWQQASQVLQAIDKTVLRQFLEEYPGFDLGGSFKSNGGNSLFCKGDDCEKVGCDFKNSDDLAGLTSNPTFTQLESAVQNCFLGKRHSDGAVSVDLNDLKFINRFVRLNFLNSASSAEDYGVPNSFASDNANFDCLKSEVLKGNDIIASFNTLELSGATSSEVINNLITALRSSVDTILNGCSNGVALSDSSRPIWTGELNNAVNRQKLVNTLINLDLQRTIDANKITLKGLLSSTSLTFTDDETIWPAKSGNNFEEQELDNLLGIFWNDDKLENINTNKFNYFIKSESDASVQYSPAHTDGFTTWKSSATNTYSLIGLSDRGYENVCDGTTSKLGFDYVAKRRSKVEVSGNDVTIFYPLQYDEDFSLVDVVKDFLSKMHYNYEVGYQEETCESKIAKLVSWEAWGTTCVDPDNNSQEILFGKGVQVRQRGCSFAGIQFQLNQNDPDNKFWEPVDYADWKAETGLDFTPDCGHCQERGEVRQTKPCLKECEYGQWTSWISFDISKDNVPSRTSRKTCVKKNAKAFGKDFYDYLKENGDESTTQIDLSGTGIYYDGESFCSTSSANGEYGFKYRRRSSQGKDCCETVDMEPCVIPPCPHWKEWSEWSHCSQSCNPLGSTTDSGTRVMTRSCVGEDTYGDDGQVGDGYCRCDTLTQTDTAANGEICADKTEICESRYETCNTKRPCEHLAKVEVNDELVNKWSEWTACSSNCNGRGTRSRHIMCEAEQLDPSLDANALDKTAFSDWINEDSTKTFGQQITESLHKGACVTSDLETYYQEERCTSNDNDKCELEKRSSGTWSACSKSCGGGNRLREVRLSETENDIEEQECNTQECPLYTDWTECTGLCVTDNGSRYRHKLEDQSVEDEACNREKRCPFWSGWGQWSSCVNDQYTRSRTCVDFDEAGVSAKDKFCVGSDEQSVPCTADEVCETEADPQDDGTQP